MKIAEKSKLKFYLQILFCTIYFSANCIQAVESIKDKAVLEEIKLNRNHPEILAELLPIVKCPFAPTQYEKILMTELRDKQTSMKKFREISKKITSLLVFKVIETLPVVPHEIETPLIKYDGITFAGSIDFVSVMRSGDALLETFIEHFPEASISKILVQRDETTAEPEFKYMKLSSSLNENSRVVITEPMIATGGTLSIVIQLLKEKGVPEENITIASICTAPEGLLVLNNKFPKINVVMTVMDDRLDERKYIVPGLGDFGDRFFGTNIR